MKKLIALILFVTMLLPASALTDESDVVGCWVHYSVLTNGAPGVEFLYLSEDHTSYYLIQTYKPTEAWNGRTHVGTWVMNEDGTVTAQVGNVATINLSFSDEYTLAMSDLLSVFVNITPFTLAGAGL